MPLHPVEKFRKLDGSFKSTPQDGPNGVFIIPHGSYYIQCIISSGLGWEHLSATIRTNKGEQKTPSWETMCMLKDTFWDDDDTVIQFHPKKSMYVNTHEHVLHLWRKLDQEHELPPLELV